MTQKKPYVCWFEDLCSDDVAIVGGKNASLGEMIRALKDEGIRVPDGFATTADAFQEFLEANDLVGPMRAVLNDLQRGNKSLDQVGRALRRLFERTHFPEAIAEAIGHPQDRGPAVQHSLGDHLHSSNVVADSGGAMVNREEFTPYGETSFGSGSIWIPGS